MVIKQRFTPAQGAKLLKLARQSLENRLLNLGHDLSFWQEEAFQVFSGTFVTLKKGTGLRGCMGHIDPDEPIFDSIRDRALDASLKDPRFPPLTPDELREIRLEVSVLTPPCELEGEDNAAKVAQIRPFVDGVVIEQERHRATFLPQVWESLSDRDQFLGELCKKARLAEDAWKTSPMIFYTYQVQHFEEEE